MEGTLSVNYRWLITASASLIASCVMDFGVLSYCHHYINMVSIGGVIGGAMPAFLIAALFSVWMRDTVKFLFTSVGAVAAISYLEVLGRHGHC